uniref:EGF domain-specific O-linked N-acetylglucosamine transferase n=1 Tax=Phallusia mammillata TaxID=59560 RepID=A0A6F9DCS2_9ASCI|nr:glycosyltransferase aer61 precursor [Phallusia mammillata]
MTWYYVTLLVLLRMEVVFGFDWSSLKLVRSHVPFVFSHQFNLKQECENDPECPYKEFLKDQNSCWGYEDDCDVTNRFMNVTMDCSDDTSKERYFRQADFGFLRERLEEMKSREFCKPGLDQSAFLRCTKDSSMCEARNLFVDLRKMRERIHDRRKVALESGEIGGACSLDAASLAANTRIKRDLSTWGEQVGPYTQLEFDPFDDTNTHCDVTFTRPVVFVQLDFGGNMYHHFCNFFNLYLTQLANSSWFGTDVQIIRWDASPRYGDLFPSSWKVFTNSDHKSLADFTGKRLCIADATFAFLPRMMLGLFYSTPVEADCRGTGLFKAFSEHFLHRMGIIDQHDRPTSPPVTSSSRDKIRVTFIDRGSAENYKVYRRVLNQEELLAAIRGIPDLDVQIVEFNHRKMSFEDQLKVTRRTDIFIGMHGAGLTHFLFLPDWAVAFELYNCDDIRCYRDLPRLRGIRYLTWNDVTKLQAHNQNEHENYGKHSKFWNYTFDVDEFVRLVTKARQWVLEHPRFAHLRNNRNEL